MPDHCANHEARENDFISLKGKVDNQEGRWWVVGIVLVVALGALFWLQITNNQSNRATIEAIQANTKETSRSTKNLELNVTAYMSASTERINGFENRMSRVEEELREMRRAK